MSYNPNHPLPLGCLLPPPCQPRLRESRHDSCHFPMYFATMSDWVRDKFVGDLWWGHRRLPVVARSGDRTGGITRFHQQICRTLIAWYGHLKFRHVDLWKVILASWRIFFGSSLCHHKGLPSCGSRDTAAYLIFPRGCRSLR